MALMTTPYNLTELQGAETTLDLINYSNTITNGLFSVIVILSIFFVLLLTLKKYSFESALISSSFICFVLSLLLTYANVMNFMFPISFLGVTAFVSFYVYVIKKK